MTERGSPRSRTNRMLTLATTLGRVVPSLSTNAVPDEWDHVTKVDPETEKRFPVLFPLYLQHTDAVSVGGSSDVTPTNTEAAFELLDVVPTPALHEPSDAHHITDRTRELADLLTVPEVLNGSSGALVGTLGLGVEYLREELVPAALDDHVPSWLPTRFRDALSTALTAWLLETAAFEAYIIQNPESAAARRGGVTAADVLSPVEAKRRALAADFHLDSEVVYLEYSGTYGGDAAVETLGELADAVTRSKVWYGGGIDSREKATEMLAAGADAVVVGDAFHRVADEERALFERLREDVDGASRASVESWLDANVTPAETAAAGYLSTVPAVEDPHSLAETYLTRSLTLLLALDPSSGSAFESGGESASTVVADRLDTLRRTWDGYDALDAALVGDDDRTLAFLAALVRYARDRTATDGLPVAYLSVGSPEVWGRE